MTAPHAKKYARTDRKLDTVFLNWLLKNAVFKCALSISKGSMGWFWGSLTWASWRSRTKSGLNVFPCSPRGNYCFKKKNKKLPFLFKGDLLCPSSLLSCWWIGPVPAKPRPLPPFWAFLIIFPVPFPQPPWVAGGLNTARVKTGERPAALHDLLIRDVEMIIGALLIEKWEGRTTFQSPQGIISAPVFRTHR